MALRAAMVFPTLAAENDDFWATCLTHNSRTYSCTVHFWVANGDFITIAKHNNVIQNDFSAFFCGDALDQDTMDAIADQQAVLLVDEASITIEEEA